MLSFQIKSFHPFLFCSTIWICIKPESYPSKTVSKTRRNVVPKASTPPHRQKSGRKRNGSDAEIILPSFPVLESSISEYSISRLQVGEITQQQYQISRESCICQDRGHTLAKGVQPPYSIKIIM